MNQVWLRIIAVTIVVMAHVVGSVAAVGAGGEKWVKPCGQACCSCEVCCCQIQPTDQPSQPASAPVSGSLEFKFTAVASGIVFQWLPGKQAAKNPHPRAACEWLKPHAPSVLRLHCALLI